jgi:EAL domain-containing protein (putative c-di-GMP-specific phosphodiesterase class I)/FixJ family two-component response regulator
MMKAVKKILVIDDESDVCEIVCAAADAMGFDCLVATDATEFLKMLTADTSLILIDLVMPKVDGIELLRLLAEQKCQAGIILMSGTGKRIIESAGQLAQALGLSIAGHLQKPFRLSELEKVLDQHLEPEAVQIARQDNRVVLPKEEMRRAVVRDEFVLHYQPQIDIVTGHVIGVEALVRWQHPERGLIFPDSFIGRMEKIGLIDELGWLVVNRGMSEVGQFANGDGRAPMLSMNESVYSLHDLKFPDILLSLAEKHSVSPNRITIEITESGLIKELSNTLDILTRLRMKGVKLSIDDFGTGYAMMQQLKVIPATELKIDRSFILDMDKNQRDRIIVQKTIEMGHELGMHIIAEGVETKEQLDFLQLKACDSAQGYFFSRPLPANEMAAWLHTYRAGLAPLPAHR